MHQRMNYEILKIYVIKKNSSQKGRSYWLITVYTKNVIEFLTTDSKNIQLKTKLNCSSN